MGQEAFLGITWGQLVAWIILGLLIGPLIGRLVKRNKKGYGLTGNLVIGLMGAVVGGLVFNVLDITIGKDVVLTANDFIAALVGSFIFLGIVAIVQRSR